MRPALPPAVRDGLIVAVALAHAVSGCFLFRPPGDTSCDAACQSAQKQVADAMFAAAVVAAIAAIVGSRSHGNHQIPGNISTSCTPNC